MKRMVLSIIILVLGIILIFSPLYTVFSFTETRTNNPKMFYINVSKDKVFQLCFTHSIHLTDVLETYKITNDNKLKLVSMEYEDVAIGMPAHAEEGEILTYENNKYKLVYTNKVLNNFTLYVGDIDTNLYFSYNNKKYNIKKSLTRGNSYLFEVKRVSIFDKLKGVVMIHEDK